MWAGSVHRIRTMRNIFDAPMHGKSACVETSDFTEAWSSRAGHADNVSLPMLTWESHRTGSIWSCTLKTSARAAACGDSGCSPRGRGSGGGWGGEGGALPLLPPRVRETSELVSFCCWLLLSCCCPAGHEYSTSHGDRPLS